ncbi:hypothetical protein [Janthinobacterium sp. SUN137]|uniref:DUF7689 domain-containing protein n=1 Tax=Janthinobacterium sp. SUN137 TaxID=3014789 RepID=UPI002713F807|nr:hypothetical protein [Janthinobacterium sp. SUN137]MDO8042298.1 hypothetical protein [Janthinobacterium sp. SUN137]
MIKSPKFPNLNPNNHAITSPQTEDYNCIGWAAGDVDRVWWPVNHPLGYWPLPIPPESTVQAFIAAFATLGYRQCANGDFEANYEKVVLYVDGRKKPTHMARQLRDGNWTSKLGPSFDIRHSTPAAVNGSEYGTVHTFMKRPYQQAI